MNTLEYTWEGATIGMGLGDNRLARGWTVVLALEYTITPYYSGVFNRGLDNWVRPGGGDLELGDVTVVNLWHHGEPVEVTKNHQTYWSARFEREQYTDHVREEMYRHAEDGAEYEACRNEALEEEAHENRMERFDAREEA